MSSSNRPLIVETWTYLAFGLVVTGLRTYSRMREVGFKRFQADDYLAWLAAIAYVGETLCAHYNCTVALGLTNNGMSDTQRLELAPDSHEYQTRVLGSKIQIVGWLTYSVLIWTLKSSLLFYYLRFSTRVQGVRILIHFGFFLVPASWVAFLLTVFLECRPFNRNWQIYPDPGDTCHSAASSLLIWVALILNVATDIYLILIPVPMLWSSSLRLPKKLGLFVLFSGGLLVIACAISRSVLMITDSDNSAHTAALWSIRETFVATITTNLPALYPLLRYWLNTLISTINSCLGLTTRPSKGSSYNTYEFNSGSGRWRRRGGASAMNPITDHILSGSEERMVYDVHIEASDAAEYKGIKSLDNNENYAGIRKYVEIAVLSEARNVEGELAYGEHNNGKKDETVWAAPFSPQGYTI